jgi:hypothetical protein
MRSAVLWDITQRWVVVFYHISRPLKMGPIGCPETSATNYDSRLHNILEGRLSHLIRFFIIFIFTVGHYVRSWVHKMAACKQLTVSVRTVPSAFCGQPPGCPFSNAASRCAVSFVRITLHCCIGASPSIRFTLINAELLFPTSECSHDLISMQRELRSIRNYVCSDTAGSRIQRGSNWKM